MQNGKRIKLTSVNLQSIQSSATTATTIVTGCLKTSLLTLKRGQMAEPRRNATYMDRRNCGVAGTVSTRSGWFPRLKDLLWRLLPCSQRSRRCRSRQQRLHSIDHRLRQDLVHRQPRLLGHE